MSANNRPYDWANPPETLAGDNWTQPEETGFWRSLSPGEKRVFKLAAVALAILMPLDLYWAITSPPMGDTPNESVTGMILFFVLCAIAIKVLQKAGVFIYEQAFSPAQQRKLRSFWRRLLYWLGF